jgi:hypothetical protein
MYFNRKQWFVLFLSLSVWFGFMVSVGAGDPKKKKRPRVVTNSPVQCKGSCFWEVVPDNTPGASPPYKIVLASSNCNFGCLCNNLDWAVPFGLTIGDTYITNCSQRFTPNTQGCGGACFWTWSTANQMWMRDPTYPPCLGDGCDCSKPTVQTSYFPAGSEILIDIGCILDANGNIILRPMPFCTTTVCAKGGGLALNQKLPAVIAMKHKHE